MPTGRVKFFSDERGYGFIVPDEGGRDIFVHAKELRATGLERLSEGQTVEFDAALDDRSGRVHAVNVQPAQSCNAAPEPDYAEDYADDFTD